MLSENDTDNEVATITKHWGGCKELIGAVNNFTIQCKALLYITNLRSIILIEIPALSI